MAIPADMVLSELSKILGSRHFAKSGRLAAFLKYVVENTLSGKGNEIKEYVIAVEVFGKPESFDPRLDTLVRVQASKLRARLKEYYGTHGAKDEVIIELPRGCYVPTFQLGASPPPTPSTAVARTPRILRWLAVPAALLVLAGVIWSIYRLARGPDTVTSNPKSIAILPFTDMSPEKNQEYFCDGMTEEITSALSKIQDLHVVASTSAFAFKGKPQDVRSIGHQLNVGRVLEGSVRKSGDHIKVTAQLVSVPDGYHLWSETYDRELTDVFRIQEEISRSIASALKINLTRQAAEQMKPQTKSLEAYNLYLLGRYHWHNRTEAGLKNAAAYFEQAVQLDPRYARAYAGLADVYVQLDGWEFMQPNEAMPKAKEFVKKALALDPALAEAYVSRGAIYATYDWEPEAAGRDYARAVALDPAYITGHWWYGCWLEAAGRTAEARQHLDRALKLDPLSVPVLLDAALWNYESHGEHETALALCRKAIDIDPMSSLSYRFQANVLRSLDRRQDAIASIERAVDLAPDYPAALSDLAELRVGERRIAEARQILDRLLLLRQMRYVPALVIARIYFTLGDRPRTLDWLAAARKERSPRLGWYLIANGKYLASDYGSRLDPQFSVLVLKVLSAQ